MRRCEVKTIGVLAGLTLLCLALNTAQALTIGQPAPTDREFTEILLQDDADVDDPAGLSAFAEFLYDGIDNVLTIYLQNTSDAEAGSGAGILLTGIGFNLPEGMVIVSGSANVGTSTAHGFTPDPGGDVSKEWGFANPPDSGHFLDTAINEYNAVVSTMGADAKTKFTEGSIVNPPVLDGPEMGLLTSGGGSRRPELHRGPTLGSPESLRNLFGFAAGLHRRELRGGHVRVARGPHRP